MVDAVATSPDLLTSEEIFPYEESKDANRKTHIINPPNNLHIWQPGMDINDVVFIARTQGKEVQALCGYRWVPKHNPEKFDACQECIRIAGDLMRERGE